MGENVGIGASLRRKEDLRFITGKGNYVADIKLPDMTVMVLLRSQHAHAHLRAIDTSAAKALPGVLAIYTGADMKQYGTIQSGLPFPKTRRIVFLAGQPATLAGFVHFEIGR